VVGRVAAVLTRVPRAGAFVALAGALAAYYAWSELLWNGSTWSDVAFISLALVPAVFGLVYLALPLRRRRALELVLAGAALVLVTWALEEAGKDAVANFTKLAAATLLGFSFVAAFETAFLVALVALVIPWVDAYSVWRGPTSSIVSDHPQVFTTVSFALPIPGEHDAARLGPPDLLFFAFFLAAAERFGLRVGWTWLCMTLSFGVTLTIAVAADVGGLPALPGLAIGFLLPNADLLWRQFRLARQSRQET
jgi:hypothetical protein